MLTVSHLSSAVLLAMVAGIVGLAHLRGVKVYDTFIEGAKEGLDIVLAIIPYLVGFVVAIGLLRAAGVMERLARLLRPVLDAVGFPVELLPLALVRPFSGAASNGVLVDILHTHGGDSMLAHTASTMMGSTETTFYVVALYFGAVGIERIRHAAWAGLIADGVGVVASVWICHWLLPYSA